MGMQIVDGQMESWPAQPRVVDAEAVEVRAKLDGRGLGSKHDRRMSLHGEVATWLRRLLLSSVLDTPNPPHMGC